MKNKLNKHMKVWTLISNKNIIPEQQNVYIESGMIL